MKKLVLFFVGIFALSTVAIAGNDRPLPVSQLPEKAQIFLNTYFKDSKVALAKQENEFFYKSYEVIFVSGDKVEFNNSGEWTEVDCRTIGVPSQIIPEAIKEFVMSTYPDATIMKIERDSRGYEIKLSNRLEIDFNNNFMVVDIDD